MLLKGFFFFYQRRQFKDKISYIKRDVTATPMDIDRILNLLYDFFERNYSFLQQRQKLREVESIIMKRRANSSSHHGRHNIKKPSYYIFQSSFLYIKRFNSRANPIIKEQTR